MAVQLRTEISDQRWNRIVEVLVLAPAEAVSSHIDPATEQVGVVVHRTDVFAFGSIEHWAEASVTIGPEILDRFVPIQFCNSRLHVCSLPDSQISFHPVLAVLALR